jgi:hypothetical protein
MRQLKGAWLAGMLLLAACGGGSQPAELVGRWQQSRVQYGTNPAIELPAASRSVRQLNADGTYWWAVRNPGDTLQADTLRGTWEQQGSLLVLVPQNSGTGRAFTLRLAEGQLHLTDDESSATDTWTRLP